VNPEIRYAKSGDVHIAYQVFGNGPDNLVIIPGFISHVEHVWDSPDQAAWFNHLARRTRVVMFDKRGTGLSDRLGQLPNLDQRMDDVRAAMDARVSSGRPSWACPKAVRLRRCLLHLTPNDAPP
jgi:pimeloyl-ACP methyl ester carboxylesterase